MTAFLMFVLGANALTAFTYVTGGATIATWAIPVFGISSLLNVASAVAIWRWRRWGVYGFVVTSALVFITNVGRGVPILHGALGLLGIVILGVLIRPVWGSLK